MKLLLGIVVPLLSLASAALAASAWTFDDATLTIQGKGSGVGGGVKEKYAALYSLLEPLLI